MLDVALSICSSNHPHIINKYFWTSWYHWVDVLWKVCQTLYPSERHWIWLNTGNAKNHTQKLLIKKLGTIFSGIVHNKIGLGWPWLSWWGDLLSKWMQRWCEIYISWFWVQYHDGSDDGYNFVRRSWIFDGANWKKKPSTN